MKILMVCLGNICRSPLAEGILRSKLQNSNKEHFIDSAGTGGWHAGQAPDHRSVAIAKEKGLDISGLKARQFKQNDFNDFDLILVMDHSNHHDIRKLTANKDHHQKVHLYLNYAGITEIEEVPDPYYGGKRDFEEVYELLERAADNILLSLKKSH